MPISRLAVIAASFSYMAALPVVAAGLPEDLMLTPFQAREDLELAVAAVEEGLPNIYWHQSRREWRDAKARARSQVRGAGDSEALWRILRPLMSRIGEGHLGLQPSEAMNSHYHDAWRFPLDVLWTREGVFVLAGYGEAHDIGTGTRLLAIDGVPMPALFDELFAAGSHDGAIPTGVMRDLSGRGLAAMLFRLHGPQQSFTIEVQSGTRRIVRHVPAVPRTARPPEPDDPPPVPALEWLGADTAYLNVPTFSNRRFKAVGIDFRQAVQEIFTRLRQRGTRNLILDLRENGGGSEPNEAILFSYLVDRPLRRYTYVEARGAHVAVTSLSGKRFERDVFDSDELDEERPTRRGRLRRRNIPPDGLMTRWSRFSPVYHGRLVILAGGNTFSGGAELASMLHHVRRGIFVGEEVGGMQEGNTSGVRWSITLPNSGMTLTVPLLQFRIAWPALLPGHGVQPDCYAPPNAAEVSVRRDHGWRVALALFDRPWRRPRALCPLGVH